ncbi:Panacea domain-containing protein [Veillonella sp. 20925_1_51]|uniref:Panacea domain-containing protein n=1 Tax=Veillonella sp. 20925_1_51 TaxID=3003641 RepID=UPI00352D0702
MVEVTSSTVKKDMSNTFTDTSRHAKTIAMWFLQRNKREQKDNFDVEGISNLKLQKLLYYAYGCYLASTKKRLFSEHLEAWQHGPVVPEIYDIYKHYGAGSINSDSDSKVELEDEITDVLEWVYNEFGQFTAWALRNRTHEERPWLETEQSQTISDDLIYEYFVDKYVEI